MQEPTYNIRCRCGNILTNNNIDLINYLEQSEYVVLDRSEFMRLKKIEKDSLMLEKINEQMENKNILHFEEISSLKSQLDKYLSLRDLIDPKSRQLVSARETIEAFRDEFLEPCNNFLLLSTKVYEKYREWCDKAYSPDIGPKSPISWGIFISKTKLFTKKSLPDGVRLVGWRFKSN